MTRRILQFIEDHIPAILLFVMTVTILVDVVGRYVFNKPLKGGPEIATLSFVWLVLLSVAGSYRTDKHMKITSVLAKRFPGIQKVLNLMIDVSILLTSLYTLYISKELIGASSSRYMELIGIPYSFVYFSVSVCFFLLTVHSINKIILHVKGIFTP